MFLMAPQNPFTIFSTSEDRLILARKIVQGISDFNPTDCAKIALTFALNPSLMDDLTVKDSRMILELAKQCSEVPWKLPESAVQDQSAPPSHALAEPHTTDVAPAAVSDTAAQSALATAGASATKAPDVAQPLPHALIEPDSSAVPDATVDRDSKHFHNVYIRRHWYDFSPAVINDFFDRTEVDVRFTPDYDLIASSLSNSHYLTWPKKDTKKPGKPGDLESSFLPSSFAILLRMATTNWLPTVTVHSVSKKMVVLLFKIRNNIPFNLGELIFDHIMAFCHGQGKEDKVLLPFSSLIYGILCKQGFQKHPQEDEMFLTSKYSIDKRMFLNSHFDDCSTFKSAVVPEEESVPSQRRSVSVDFAAVSARVISTQSILTSLKSTIVRMEKVLLDDKKLLQSFEAGDVGSDSAPAR
nr:uncharacterized protein LOC109153488 [Ipomoea batatas]